MFPNPVARLDMIGMRVLGDPGSLSLFGCEIALLTFGNLIETTGGF